MHVEIHRVDSPNYRNASVAPEGQAWRVTCPPACRHLLDDRACRGHMRSAASPCSRRMVYERLGSVTSTRTGVPGALMKLAAFAWPLEGTPSTTIVTSFIGICPTEPRGERYE